MTLPDFLKSFAVESERYLQEGLIGEIDFSGPTYQVQMQDLVSGEQIWAFLQLDSRGQIKDSFCSCNEGEDLTHCPHIAAAYLAIYRNSQLPLHLRFENSLWYQLCRLYGERLGDSVKQLQLIEPGHYVLNSVGGKQIFFVKAKTAAAILRLKAIIEERPEETEETSLKFSNLPPEEIVLWREGRPSAYLIYELSFWNDFAHWLMLMQDSGANYTLNFNYSPKQIPNEVLIDFPEVEMNFYISEAKLPELIPSLAHVKSPLIVHNAPQESIERITYDKKSRSLLIELKKPQTPYSSNAPSKSISLEGWFYVPEDGFYAKDPHQLLAIPQLTGQQVSEALNEHHEVIRNLLEGTILHEEHASVSYSLAFDAQWNLHITAYVFNVGDLSQSFSYHFGDWAYIDDDGFYKLDNMHFDSVEKMIPQSSVAEFVRQERVWLNTQEGFQTHLVSIEAQLTYSINKDKQLIFQRRVAVKDKPHATKDFGQWIYVAGQGFYSKISQQIGLPLRPNIAISADQIPLFIRINRDELHSVPGFFSDHCPVEKMKLNIELSPQNEILISPEYELYPSYSGVNIIFFDNFAYVEGQGFHEVPINPRIPERYRHATQIEAGNLELFLDYEIEELLFSAVTVDPRLLKPSQLDLVAKSIVKPTSQGQEWYELKLYYRSKHAFVPLAQLWEAQKQKKRFVFSEAGLIDIKQESFNWIKLIPKSRLDKRSNILQLSTLELIRLNAIEGLSVEAANEEEQLLSEQLLTEITDFLIPQAPDLTGLNSNLRNYQENGVRWLWFLYTHHLSGLLCDDMGLGKTHQAMALLAAIRNEWKQKKQIDPNHKLHFLVVCPTSVIYHWQEKLSMFLPGIRICTFHGSNRSLEDFHHEYDILLTSYSIWRIENALLSKVLFEVAIFDEIQIAKNHSSRVHSSLLSVQTSMRLGLTGTPIENNLRELKALFDIVLPTYMPSDADFRQLFVKPIEREGNLQKRDILSRFIKPFMLRRKKEDVLLDLPEKTEEIAHCVLEPDQAALYASILKQSRENLIKQLEDSNTPVPYIHVFALLSNLKQICNHPAVYLKEPGEYKNYQSGKWNLFVELLDEARESRQKVVVFSQYLLMLDIFEEYLNELGIGFATIRGATTNRGEQIRRFNNDPDCEVFIGSLQASGLGIDLTAGSVVIHYDRWWNAARENQATDRVHRIGQTRGVQVFKLVTKDTFEEKIDQLIMRKGRLMEEVVSVDDHNLVKQFDRNELIQLLQFVDTTREQSDND